MPLTASATGGSFVRPGDKRCKHSGPLLERRDRHRVDLVRIPWREGDHHAGREVLLEQLKRLRVGVCRPVLARLQPRVPANDDKGPVGLARVHVPHLLADSVQARGDVLERRDEGAVR